MAETSGGAAKAGLIGGGARSASRSKSSPSFDWPSIVSAPMAVAISLARSRPELCRANRSSAIPFLMSSTIRVGAVDSRSARKSRDSGPRLGARPTIRAAIVRQRLKTSAAGLGAAPSWASGAA